MDYSELKYTFRKLNRHSPREKQTAHIIFPKLFLHDTNLTLDGYAKDFLDCLRSNVADILPANFYSRVFP